jgi:hypothetical protein
LGQNAIKKHKRADKAAHREAVAFFIANPDRQFHVQTSRRFEFADWGQDDHLRSTRTLVFLDRSTGKSRLRRKAVASDGPIPDTDEFLFELWAPFLLENTKRLDIPAHEHARLLQLHEGES